MRQRPPPVRRRPSAAAGASRTAAQAARYGWKTWAIAAIAAVFLTLTGAFGTGAAPLGPRLAYWLSTLMVGSTAALFVSAAVERGGWFDDRPFLQGLLIAVALSLPLTVAVWAITEAAFGGGAMGHGLLGTFPPVFVVTCAVTAINFLAHRRPVETRAAPAGAPPVRFLERFPDKLRGAELYAVQAEDHYLRLHTSRGSDLILMRLSDAVAELDGLEGAQTHRSWWVARAAIDEARRGDGRAVLHLKGGAEAPVSRSYAKALRDEGWF